MTPHPVDLDALQKLLDRGAVRPWRVWGGPDLYTNVMSHGLRVARCDLDGDFRHPGAMANADLVVAAVNALPALIAEVRAARRVPEVILEAGRALIAHFDMCKLDEHLCSACAVYINSPLASPSVPPPQEDGVALIAAERKRQVEKEGWTPEHDAKHADGELAQAAIVYATPPNKRKWRGGHGRGEQPILTGWPWDDDWFKPGPDRVRELVKAGALIAAEIDRLRPAPPVLEEKAAQEQRPHEACRPTLTADAFDHHPKAQETAALKEGREVVPSADVAARQRNDPPTEGGAATPGAVSQQPGTAPACPECGPLLTVEEMRKLLDDAVPGAEEFGRSLKKVFRLPDEDLILDAGAATSDPREAPPSAPALPKEEVAPSKPLVYLACPYSHVDRAVRVGRFEAANVAASALMRDGLKVFSPISHTHPIAEAGGLPLGFDYWEAFDRAYIGHSYKVIVLRVDGWRESKGVQAEIRIAAEYRIPVEYIDPAPAPQPLPEEQQSKEGSAAAPDGCDRCTAERPCSWEHGRAPAAPAPEDGPVPDAGVWVTPAWHEAELARVRSEERERRDERADNVFEALFDVNEFLKSTAGDWAAPHTTLCFCDQGGECPAIAIRAEAKALLSKAEVALENYRARASDATSAGGGK